MPLSVWGCQGEPDAADLQSETSGFEPARSVAEAGVPQTRAGLNTQPVAMDLNTKDTYV
jgi:hypothetical protein